MYTTKIYIPLALIAILAMSSTAMAYGHGNGPRQLPQLTPKVQAKANKVTKSFRDTMYVLKQDMLDAQLELDALTVSGQLEKKDAKKLIAEMRQLRNKMNDERADFLEEYEDITGLQFQGYGHYGHNRHKHGGNKNW
ncbi:MAG: hypothetical protein ACNI27_02720 [Desulfovibrio sp.]